MKLTLALLPLALTLTIYAKDVYTAIKHVESNGNSEAVGDGGRAVGSYQIHKIYVDDVNRITKKKYTYDDRKDEKKSLEMVKHYTGYYGKYYTKVTGKPVTDEIIARIHNGGSFGWKKESTNHYWKKVRKEIEK